MVARAEQGDPGGSLIICGAHYSASKGALNAMSRTLATELGPHGIRVNVIARGLIATDMSNRENDETAKQLFALAEARAPLAPRISRRFRKASSSISPATCRVITQAIPSRSTAA